MQPIEQAIGIAILCGRLADHGVRFAALSPGSRSAPITLSITQLDRVHCVPVIDERSAGFVALGAAKQTGSPAMVVTTSGTAAANLAPAMHEAHEARVPLIGLTADRPPELRHVGEGQTIDQVRLFGSAAEFFEIDNGGTESDWLKLADAAVEAALSGRPGPVQINIALRPPLDVVAPPVSPAPVMDPHPTATAPTLDTAELESLLAAARRPLCLAGRDERGGGRALATLADAWGAPLLADPLAGAASDTTSVSHWDSLLRCREWADAARPDLVIRTGDMPTSKPLRAWLQSAASEGATVVEFDPESAERDPLAITRLRLGHPASAALGLSQLKVQAEPGWLELWRTAADAAIAAVDAALERENGLNEPAAARAVAESLDDDDVLLVSASMPIRDLEAFLPASTSSVRVLSNRGANGIDGVISTGIGMAAAGNARVTVLIGDVAFAHDHSALMLMRDLQPNLRVVIIDNGAGTIFDTLPVANSASPAFENYFATPTRLPVRSLAEAWNINRIDVSDLAGLQRALQLSEGPTLVHVQLERSEGHRVRARLHEAVAVSLGAKSSG